MDYRKYAVIIMVLAPMILVPAIQSGDASAADTTIAGTGSEDDPFIIDSVDDLRSIGTEGYGMDRNYRQVGDLTFAWDDALDTDDALTLKANIIEIDGGDVLEIEALLNGGPIMIDPEKDVMSVSVNGKVSSIPGKWAVPGSKEAIFHFPADVFVPGEKNVVSLCGSVSSVPLGTASAFSDVPFRMTEYIGGNFTPIGTIDDPFRGSYDGGGHTITGMKVFVAANNPSAGMFGYTENATISDLTLTSGENDTSYFIASSVHGTPFGISFGSTAGSLIGSMTLSSLESVCNRDCVVISSNIETLLTASDTEGFSFVPNGTMTASSGGIVGEGDGSITASVYDGHTVSMTIRIRNIYLNGETDSGATFDIGTESETFSNAGGFVGSGSVVTITNSSSEGDVFASSDCRTYVLCRAEHVSESVYSDYMEKLSVYSGGIVGSATSLNAVNVTSGGRTYAMKQSECLPYTSDDSVLFDDSTSPVDIDIGGIVGHITDEIIMRNCSASGDVVFNDAFTENPLDLAAGGLIGESDAYVTKIRSSCATNILSGNGTAGGLIGIGSLSGMNQTYYSHDSPLDPSGDHPSDNTYANIGVFDAHEFGNEWDFDRVWILDQNDVPVINLRFSVDFVSEDDGFFDIASASETEPDAYIVNGTSSDFTILLDDEVSQSQPVLRYENGDAIDIDDGDFIVDVLLDENGSPVDRTITVSGIELNEYSVSMPSVPDGVIISLSEGTVTHGGEIDVAFSSETYDLSRVTLISTGGDCNIADNGDGTYSVFNITGDVELFLKGSEEIGDLTVVSNILYATAILVSVGVLYGAIKLIRLKRIT